MPRLFLSHLLGVLLLLSQLPGESQGNGSEIIKLCGSDLVLFWIRLCGNLNWDRMALSQERSRLGSGQPAGERSRPCPLHIPHWLPSGCRPIGTGAPHVIDCGRST